MPWSSLAFTVAALSMIGLPPTAGFFSKWYLLLGSVEEKAWLYVAVIVVSSLMNAVYFFRVLERLYLAPHGPHDAEPPAPTVDGDTRPTLVLPVLFLGAALLALGLGNVIVVRTLIQPMLPAGF